MRSGVRAGARDDAAVPQAPIGTGTGSDAGMVSVNPVPGGDPVEGAAQTFDSTIRAELDGIEQAARELAARCRKIGAGGRGAGLTNASAVWSRELEATADKVKEEGPRVSKALLGTEPVEVVTHANGDLSVAAASDPERKR